jgi:hypothetical protein
MLQIYKKCEKSVNNPYGVKEIKDLANYDRPFLLCISAQDQIDKSVFGIIKEGARAARVRTSDELAGGFKIDEMPLDFLGIKYTYSNIKDKKASSLVDDFLYPFLLRGVDIFKQARKINLFVYCNAANVYVQAEKRLKELLLKDGYLESEIKDILSQIGLISIASEIDISRTHATSILFKDANDSDVYDRNSKIASDRMISSNRMSYVGRIGNNSLFFGYNGSGEHELKEYLKDDNLVKPSLCSAVSYLVESSILNSMVDELIPINRDQLLKRVRLFNGEFEENKGLLDNIDLHLNYYAHRYSSEEHDLLCKLDKVCKKLVSTQRFLESESKELESEKEKNNKLITGIREKCSDVAFEQIVTANGMWNNERKESLRDLPTDRQIRKEYEELIEEKGISRTRS